MDHAHHGICDPDVVTAGAADGSVDAKMQFTNRANIKGITAMTKNLDNRFEIVNPFPSFLQFFAVKFL
jgi:hypothetical protein